ncbi:hypothetical protein EV44_g3593 [Erysiphe necator]|uniref:CCHC-type domain-containing protein n=1 Tax=Uncinula necator TaxID=52586 RepID=A0A0B1NZX0_UNCNE|nr:hypothetical protein EV44_g3593 [Erysiphe necator]
MATDNLPKFEQAGRFLGEGYSGARWLSRLDYDFKTAGHKITSPEIFFFAIDILFEGEAASWLDSNPVLREIVDNRDSATDKQVADFKAQLIERFPAKLVNHTEGNLQNDIKTFAQRESEPLTAYYQRAVHLLRRSHGRDTPRNASAGRPLVPIEQSVLNSIISVFLDGLRDEEVRCEVFSRATLSCGSLWRCHQIIDEVKQGLDATREARERAAERKEVAQIRAMCAAHYGKSLTSVLADFSSGKLTSPKARQGYSNEFSSDYKNQKPQNQPQPHSGTMNIHENKQMITNSSAPGKVFNNRLNEYPPKNLSRNAFINGSAEYRPSDGPLCFGCGMLGHIKPKCQNLQLQNWEQNHLRYLIYEQKPPQRDSNLSYYFHRDNSNGAQIRPRRPLNPLNDLHSNVNEYQVPNCQYYGHFQSNVQRNDPQQSYQPRFQNTNSNNPKYNQQPENPIPQEQERDNPQVSWSVPQNNQFEDQPYSDCTLSQFAGINIPDERHEKISSNACELDAHFESYSSGPSKKRPRIDIEEILNDNISKVSNTMNEDPLLHCPTKSLKKGRRALKHLREIVGREGCGPINYIDLAKRISIPINLLELWQVSPDAAKGFRRLSTRVNKKKSKRTPTEFFSTSAYNNLVKSSENCRPNLVETKAFRVPVVARAEANGKILKVALPKHVSQADQGSEMNIISQGLVNALKLERLSLGQKGFSGLTMNTADGSATELSHFVSLHIGVCGIWRRIDAFVRPVLKKNGELDLHLLLGIPWLHDVNASIFIRDSRIALGDPQRNERIAVIQGPTFVPSSNHRLVLYPRSNHNAEINKQEIREQAETQNSADSESDTTDALSDSDDSDDSDFEDELPRVMKSPLSKN